MHFTKISILFIRRPFWASVHGKLEEQIVLYVSEMVLAFEILLMLVELLVGLVSKMVALLIVFVVFALSPSYTR